MTVLVIDDQIHVVEGILSEVSWENLGVDKVWKAYNAVEAKGILLLNKVDIMLCDIEMPGESGLEFIAGRKRTFPAEVDAGSGYGGGMYLSDRPCRFCLCQDSYAAGKL